MRIANFQMGFERSTDYGTTTELNNKFAASKQQAKSSDGRQAQIDRVQKNRQPNYDFGRDQVDYKSMAKNDFGPQHLGNVKQS